jgi:hypothetical protein
MVVVGLPRLQPRSHRRSGPLRGFHCRVLVLANGNTFVVVSAAISATTTGLEPTWPSGRMRQSHARSSHLSTVASLRYPRSVDSTTVTSAAQRRRGRQSFAAKQKGARSQPSQSPAKTSGARSALDLGARAIASATAPVTSPVTSRKAIDCVHLDPPVGSRFGQRQDISTWLESGHLYLGLT